MKRKNFLFLLLLISIVSEAQQKTWISDNGNGTFTNPLFYEEFSDPDMIRVDDDCRF